MNDTDKVKPSSHGGFLLQLDPETLKPLIEQVVGETLARLEADRAKLDGKLAYSEPEAAQLLGVETHVLRDARRRGEIDASVIAGGRIRYTAKALADYLARQKWSMETRRQSGWPAGKRREKRQETEAA
jgi:hypothetical protein